VFGKEALFILIYFFSIKFSLQGKIMFNNGTFFLSPENLKLVGGNVEGMRNVEYLVAALENVL
jgi:hypothetical protein